MEQEQNYNSKKLSVEEFKQRLLKEKTTTLRFRMTCSVDEAVVYLTASYMAEVELRNRTCELDDDTLAHIYEAARWLVGDVSKPGLFICGKVGNGKTTLTRAIARLIAYKRDHEPVYDEHMVLRIIDARDVCQMMKDNYENFKTLCNRPMLAVDDFGVEPAEVVDYGNIINPVTKLLSVRYDLQLFTILTSNLAPDEVGEVYDERLADRFNEMFHNIPFTNPSYRTPKKDGNKIDNAPSD